MHGLTRYIHGHGCIFAATGEGFQRDNEDLHKSARDLSRAARHYLREKADFSRPSPTFANRAADILCSGEENGFAGAQLVGGYA